MGKGRQKQSVENTDRRNKVLGEKKSPKLWYGLAAVLLAGASILAWSMIKGGGTTGAVNVTNAQVMERVDYGYQTIAMTQVAPVIRSGMVEIPLEVVKEKKLVLFDYQNQGKELPLMAYVTPAGKLITAVSMCEPCKSTRFHIEGKHMVCNACYTRWDLESLQGISGGCTAYPPDVLANTIEDGTIRIKESDVVDWRPRT